MRLLPICLPTHHVSSEHRMRSKWEGKEGQMTLTLNVVGALLLPAGKQDHFEWDDALPGFGVRLRGDSKRWLIQSRVGLQQRRESLGDVRKVKLDDARRIARQRFAQAELGTDPAAERARAPNAAAAPNLPVATVAGRNPAPKEDVLGPATSNQANRHLPVLWNPLANR